MNNAIIILIILILAGGGYFVFRSNVVSIDEQVVETQQELAVEPEAEVAQEPSTEDGPSIMPISHATMVLTWRGLTLYVDPVGGAAQFEDIMAPDIVLLTDIHPDHFDVETITGVISPKTVLIVPQVVYDALPAELRSQATVMANGQVNEQNGFTITALPMYNLPETGDARHVKGRGNGYVVQGSAYRVYIAGDTAGIPEMLALEDIDMAFIPMNEPYTMSVEEAAEAVLAFAPTAVIPYHYRGPDGLADIAAFKNIVTAANPAIQVLLLNWYPEAAEPDAAAANAAESN